jgi:2-keto-4-pentenoate hydratase/2-oxohepta-3-ene-1,7-dioic acid hydratase in catechol pathway
MKLATFERSGQQRIGVVTSDLQNLVDLAQAKVHPALASMQALIDSGAEGLAMAQDIADNASPRMLVALSQVRLLAPVPVPMQIRDFLVSEKLFRQARLQNLRLRSQKEPNPEEAVRQGLEQGICNPPQVWYEQPIYFKANRFSVIGTETDVEWPSYSETFDYELEMGMFIGKTGKNILREDAGSHIFGYTIFNDMSARDAMNREMPVGLGPAKGKDFDTGNVIGPWIVTADEIPDPYNLQMEVRINGKFRSRGTLAEMHHKFEDMIAHVSKSETLHAGELFGSGTIGDGSGQEHGIYLSPGDVIELEIEKIGVLRNRVVRK